jgi:hypothetical protein
MEISLIFGTGLLCLSLVILAVVLTVIEFKKSDSIK